MKKHSCLGHIGGYATHFCGTIMNPRIPSRQPVLHGKFCGRAFLRLTCFFCFLRITCLGRSCLRTAKPTSRNETLLGWWVWCDPKSKGFWWPPTHTNSGDHRTSEDDEVSECLNSWKSFPKCRDRYLDSMKPFWVLARIGSLGQRTQIKRSSWLNHLRLGGSSHDL